MIKPSDMWVHNKLKPALHRPVPCYKRDREGEGDSTERDGRRGGVAGCQFNWLKNRLKNRLKNHLRSNFDFVTCLNYPFLVFSHYRKSQVVLKWFFKRFFKRFFSQLNWHPGA